MMRTGALQPFSAEAHHGFVNPQGTELAHAHPGFYLSVLEVQARAVDEHLGVVQTIKEQQRLILKLQRPPSRGRRWTSEYVN
jgi:hypothetical protein